MSKVNADNDGQVNWSERINPKNPRLVLLIARWSLSYQFFGTTTGKSVVLQKF